jgi:putative ABC transport system permease protein
VHGYTEQRGDFWGFSTPDLEDVRRQSRSLTIAAWTYGGGTISEPGEPEYVNGRKISPELFSTLGILPVHGRALLPEEDRPGAEPVAVISYALWQRRFRGDSTAIGKSLVFEGRTYTVVGIAPAGFQLSGDADVFTPLGQSADPRRQNRAARFIRIVARLRPHITLDQAQSEITLIASQLAREYPKTNEGITMRVHPLQQELVRDVGATLWLLLSAVGLLLLLACVNIAGLFLTRAISREREFAMRVALGAERGRLMRQCLTESAVLGICGGFLGVLLAAVSLRPFVAFWPGSLPRADEIQLDSSVLWFAIAVSLLSGVLFGTVPALRVPSHKLEQVLRAGGRTVVGSSRRLHNALVTAEIALACVLLVCAGMLGKTLLTLSALDPGLNTHNVLTARFALSPTAVGNPSQIRSAWQDVLDRARRLPDVEFAALTDIVPMREGENSLPYRTTAAPLPAKEEPVALASCVTPDYLNVMGIPLRQGRFFNEHDHQRSEPVVVIDENLARHAFGDQRAVGKRLWIPAMGNAPVHVVGVVGHVRHWGLARDDQSRVRHQIYYPFSQVPAPLLRFFSSIMSVTVRTKTDPLNVIRPLQFELRGAATDQVLYEVRTMEQLAGASLARHRFLLFLFGVFAGIALILASSGLYGVLAYLTAQRVPEIGVRMALGATVHEVITMVLRQGAQMAIGGVSLGIVAALAAGRVLQRFVHGMAPVQVATFAVMITFLLAAAVVAGLVPALRASRIDPVRALRQE